MLGKNELGIIPLGVHSGETGSLFVNFLQFDFEFESIDVQQFRPARGLGAAALGAKQIGAYTLGARTGTETLLIGYMFFQSDFDTVQPEQIHFLILNSMSFDLTFVVPNPSQAQSVEAEELTIDLEFESIVTNQEQNPSVNGFSIEHEFQSVNIFLDRIDFDSEFENVIPSQVQNIATINDFTIGKEFEQCLPVQVHIIPNVLNMTFANYFEATGNTQIHISQTNNIEFGLSFNKVFPETILGGYMFVTVNDDGKIYNLSFEGIESE